MSQIIGGSVSYERLVKTGDFENKKLSCTLTFTIDDGEINSALPEIARSRAIKIVEEGLQMKLAEASVRSEPAKVEAPAAPKTRAKKAPEPKSDPASIEAGLKEAVSQALPEGHSDPAAIEGIVNAGKTRTVADQLKAAEPGERIIDTGQKVDPASMVYPSDSRAASNADLITGAVPASGIDRTAPSVGEDFGVAPAEIANDQLVKHVNAAIARGANPESVRKLLPAYGAEKLSGIAQERRQAFVEAVGQLA